jgi:hypothetical protein
LYPDFHRTDDDLSVGAPDLEKSPGFALERTPPAGLPGPKFGLGFQPAPAFLSAREVELGYGFALLGR